MASLRRAKVRRGSVRRGAPRRRRRGADDWRPRGVRVEDVRMTVACGGPGTGRSADPASRYRAIALDSFHAKEEPTGQTQSRRTAHLDNEHAEQVTTRRMARGHTS